MNSEGADQRLNSKTAAAAGFKILINNNICPDINADNPGQIRNVARSQRLGKQHGAPAAL